MTQIMPLWSLYSDVFGADLLRYVLGAGGTYVILNVLLAGRLARQKIRSQSPPKGQILREVLASVRTVLIFAAAGTSIALGARSGLMFVYQDAESFGWPYLVFSTMVLVVLHDAWFYWTHRMLHYPPLFRRFHRLHHRSFHPTPFTSYSFDVGEAVINAAYLPLVLVFLPAHPIALFVFVTHMMLRNAIGHCGIEVFPANRHGRPVFGWLTTVTHHDLHHANARYNHGLYFVWWDRLMRTEHPAYAKTFANVAPRWRNQTVKAGALAAIVSIGLGAGQTDAFELKGHYASPGLGLIVHFERCRDDQSLACGRLAWVMAPEDAPHAQLDDTIFANLSLTGATWQGTLLDPKTGRLFRGEIRQVSADQLNMKGCAGVFCARQTWHSTRYLNSVIKEHLDR